jgi:hypothetical protein
MDKLADMRAAIAGAARDVLCAHVSAMPDEALLNAAAFRGLPAEARFRLIEALVMAAGETRLPPETRRLERLTLRLTQPGGIGAGATLGGAWVREAGVDLSFRIAPPRRSAAACLPTPDPRAGVGPTGFRLERAKALLADPRTAAFRV